MGFGLLATEGQGQTGRGRSRMGELIAGLGSQTKLDGGLAPKLFVTLSCKSSRVGILKVFAVSRCRTSSTLRGDLMSKRSRTEMWK